MGSLVWTKTKWNCIPLNAGEARTQAASVPIEQAIGTSDICCSIITLIIMTHTIRVAMVYTALDGARLNVLIYRSTGIDYGR